MTIEQLINNYKLYHSHAKLLSNSEGVSEFDRKNYKVLIPIYESFINDLKSVDNSVNIVFNPDGNDINYLIEQKHKKADRTI